MSKEYSQGIEVGSEHHQFLIVGDVHGCFHTFRELVQQYWRANDEILIQVGDLIDRGNFSPETVAMARTLEERFSGRVVFLKGNHEFEAVLYHEFQHNPLWLKQGGIETLQQYSKAQRLLRDDITWFANLPMYYGNENFFVSHAGLTDTDDPYNETNPRGVLWNRSQLKNIGKLQVIGHTPLSSNPEFRLEENVWNVDTGAYRGNALSALRINSSAKVLDIISIPTHPIDYQSQ